MTLDVARWRANLQGEVDGAAVYRAMAASERDASLATVYVKLAEAEERHGALWEAKLRLEVPIVPLIFLTGTRAIVASAALAAAALIGVGALITVVTGQPALRAGLRQLGIGVAAAAITFAVGRLVGVALG